MEFSIQSIINNAVKQDDKEREIKSWHASRLGNCLTATYLMRKGVAKQDFDERVLRVFAAGKMFEDWLVGLLKKENEKLETQVRVEWGGLSGYADLMINDLVYEIKTMNSRGFWHMEKTGAKEHHVMQLWAYLNGLKKKEGRLIYLEKDTLSIMEFPVYLNDEGREEAVKGELAILNEAWEKELPPEPIRDSKDWRYRYCNIHKEYCLKQEKYL